MCATMALQRPVNKLTAAHVVPCRPFSDLLGRCVNEGGISFAEEATFKTSVP